MELHKLLRRQLARLNIDENSMPVSMDNWQQFLERVNKAYIENDQERYMLERSMDISSRELSELNRKLEHAQHIAKLGYWQYNNVTEKILWSKEIYSMLGHDIENIPPGFEVIMQLIHPDDYDAITKKINDAFKLGQKYEAEIRIKSSDDQYHWYYIVGQPQKIENKKVTEIAGIMMDINTQKEALLHEKMIALARRAGMADVATSILHNIGNILNTANVSLGIIQENVKQSYFNKLFSINKLLTDHTDQLSQYLIEDEKGKLIPEFLIAVIKKIEKIHTTLIVESTNLQEQIEHIKDITFMQKSLSGTSGLIEKVFVADLIETAIKMCGEDYEKYGIEIDIQYINKIYISTDKSKILQILVNILQNAKDALFVERKTNKKIEIICQQDEMKKNLIIQIKDNGIGIAHENLTRIFSFGFTTKIDGHGFGLHSSALSAQELGGTLNVLSPGLHKGATFSLTLPILVTGGENNNEKPKQFSHHHH